MTPDRRGISPRRSSYSKFSACACQGLAHEVDAVGDFGHESLGEPESPVAVFKVENGAHRISAGIGGIIPGTVVVDSPIDELEVRVGAGGVHVEEVRNTEFADAEFEPAARKFFEKREEVAFVLNFIVAEGEDMVELGAPQIYGLAE